jgi:hypothetical protein
MSSTITELRQLSAEFSNDPDVRAALIGELRHRSTHSARKLLAELEMSVPFVEVLGSPRRATLLEPSPVAAPSRDLTSRYEALRATFTTEAEFLARWGMTPAMPDDLRSEVFALWEKRLGESADDRGRNLASLADDRSRADREKNR